jgi:hypothetical protein
MAESTIGVMLKRLFVRSEPAQPETLVAAEHPREPAPGMRTGPSLVLLVPRVAGVSIYQVRPFDDAHAAAAFIEECDPYRVYKQGIIAFWALHERPPHSPDVECAVLVRTEPASDLVHAYVFANLDTATSYVRFRVMENGVPPDTFIVHWVASVRVSANPSGEVRLHPALPPIPIRDRQPEVSGIPALPEDNVSSRDPVSQPVSGEAPTSNRPIEAMPTQAIEIEQPETHHVPPRDGPDLPEPTQTRWARKPGSHRFAARIKAHVLALGLMGFAPGEIEKELRAMYPGDRVPAYATISRWLRRAGISRSNLRKLEGMSEHAIGILENRLAELEGAPLEEVAEMATLLEGLRRK